MAKNKELNQQTLYPKDYSFDFESFYADPDGYMFTPDDIAYLNARELEDYEQNVPMTPYEKKLLREWVASGHSPSEHPGSKYLCVTNTGAYGFLDIYRMDREIKSALRGKNRAEREAYLKGYMGWDEAPEGSMLSPDVNLDI